MGNLYMAILFMSRFVSIRALRDLQTVVLMTSSCPCLQNKGIASGNEDHLHTLFCELLL